VIGLSALGLFVRPKLRLRFRLVDVRLFAQKTVHRRGALDPCCDAGAVRGGVLLLQFPNSFQGYGPLEAGLLELR